VIAFLDSLFGLPAHPLVVHAAVVLVPLAALGTVVIALWPAARTRVGWIVAALGVAGFFAAFLAKESGEALLATTVATPLVQDHADMGTWGVIGAFLVGGSACSVMLLDTAVRLRAAKGQPAWSVTRPLTFLVGVVAVVLSVVGTVLVVDVGHSGAKATWDGTRAAVPAGRSR